MIIEGKIKPGDMLPSQLSLAKHFGVSRPTMKEAFNYLIDDVSSNLLTVI